MAIGLASDGSEIGDQFIQSDKLSIPQVVNRALKEQQVSAAENHPRIIAFTSFFPTDVIQNALSQPGVTGLHFIPSINTDSNGNEVLTLIIASASSPQNTIEMSGLLSPCPPDCPPR